MKTSSTIILSKTNPADRLAGPDFEELKASIKEKGVLMPILVRKVADGKLEVVAGNRRYAAAREIGLLDKDIPMRVVEMTDTEAREAQIIENLQRKDVHPLDEGAAYRALIEESKQDIAQVAAKVGKSESYVRARLVLTNLDTKVQAKVRSGTFPIAHAVLIGRMPSDQQGKAFKFATQYDRVCSLLKLREYISSVVLTKAMKSPPWKDDAAAKAELARVTGLKGGEKNLFGEDALSAADDPQQWARAMAAYITLKIEEYKTNGKPLTLVSSEYSTTMKGVKGRNEYSRKEHAYYGNRKCEMSYDALVVEGDGIGTIIKICTAKNCPAHKDIPTRKASSPQQRESRKKELQAQRDKKDKDNKRIVDALAKIKWPLTEKQLDTLLDLVFFTRGSSVQQPVVKRHGLEPEVKKHSGGWTSRDYEKPLRALALESGNTGKIRLVFELLAGSYDSADEVLKRINGTRSK